MTPLQRDPRLEKLKAYAQYELYCVIPIVVLFVLPHHAVDAQHAHNSQIFRALMSLLAVLAIIFLEVKRQGLKKAIAADEAEARRQNPGSTPGVWPPPPV